MAEAFQFTPLREGRPSEKMPALMADLFQFTPLREGRRLRNQRLAAPPRISIHAPPRGATRMWRQLKIVAIFQFTPLREGRRGGVVADVQERGFQFTPLREGRQIRPALYTAIVKAFQFTPLREGRRARLQYSLSYGLFQFTPLREGRRVEALERKKAIWISIHAPPRGATCLVNK